MARSLPKAKDEIVRALAERVRCLEHSHRGDVGQDVSSGCLALDRLMPDGAFHRSRLIEFLAAVPGSGATTLALILARQASAGGGTVVVLDPEGVFYPPAAAALGLDLENLMVLRPAHARDQAWAFDQVLRSKAVAAAVCWPGRWSQATMRRLQLAAESGTALGLLLRGHEARREPSWADARLLVSPLASDGRPVSTKPSPFGRGQGEGALTTRGATAGSSTLSLSSSAVRPIALADKQPVAPKADANPALTRRRLRVELLRLRGGAAGGVVELGLDEATGSLHETTAHQTGHVHLAPPVATRAPRRRSTGT